MVSAGSKSDAGIVFYTTSGNVCMVMTMVQPPWRVLLVAPAMCADSRVGSPCLAVLFLAGQLVLRSQGVFGPSMMDMAPVPTKLLRMTGTCMVPCSTAEQWALKVQKNRFQGPP